MEKLELTKAEARRYILYYQNLFPPHSLRGKKGILDYIDRVGCIQFDPLNMVGHNHELVLQSRISDFKPLLLQELLYKERQLLDGWDKNMSIYSIKDWPYFSRYRANALKILGDSSRPAASVLPQIREEIETIGPVSSADLDHDEIVNWSWAPTRLSRAALESMYFWGELIIHHKVNTRRYYDFAHRHIPPHLFNAKDSNITDEEFYDWYVLRRINSIGLLWNKSGDAWLGISNFKSKERNEAFKRLLEQGKIIELHVEDIKIPLYISSENEGLLLEVLNEETSSNHASIIAPLDNLIWERQLTKELFNFDYRWEVYKPVSERTYGYYVLPILYGDKFVARFEPIMDKKRGTLVIKNWWWEKGIRQSKTMQGSMQKCFRLFMKYLKSDRMQIDEHAIKDNNLSWLVPQSK